MLFIKFTLVVIHTCHLSFFALELSAAVRTTDRSTAVSFSLILAVCLKLMQLFSKKWAFANIVLMPSWSNFSVEICGQRLLALSSSNNIISTHKLYSVYLVQLQQEIESVWGQDKPLHFIRYTCPSCCVSGCWWRCNAVGEYFLWVPEYQMSIF